jgi:hypothetical protein
MPSCACGEDSGVDSGPAQVSPLGMMHASYHPDPLAENCAAHSSALYRVPYIYDNVKSSLGGQKAIEAGIVSFLLRLHNEEHNSLMMKH